MAEKQPDELTVTEVTAMRQRLHGFDPGRGSHGEGPPPVVTPAPVADPSRGGEGLTQGQCIELLRELEDLKAAAAGAQAVVTAHLARSRHDAEQAAGVPADQRGRGLG